jgi:hypothetical protein
MTGPLDRLTSSRRWQLLGHLSTAQFLVVILGAGIGAIAGGLIAVATPVLTVDLP